MLSIRFESTEVGPAELGYMYPRGLLGPLAVTLTKQLKFK